MCIHAQKLDTASGLPSLSKDLFYQIWQQSFNTVHIKKNLRVLEECYQNVPTTSSRSMEMSVYVLSNNTPNTIVKIEAVQRRAAHFVLSRFKNILSVNNMLGVLGWPSLDKQCQTCRLLMLYKIQSGLAHCPTLKAKLVPLEQHTHHKQHILLTTRTQYRGSSFLSSFLPKTIRDWNLLPMEVMVFRYPTKKLPILPPAPPNPLFW